MNKILLISIQEDTEIIGLKYLHYVLNTNNYSSCLLYLPNFRGREDLASIGKFVVDLNPAFIGISLMSHEYYKACDLTKYLRTVFDGLIIWGGIHPTIATKMCLDHADYACVGEGEKVILDIADAINNKKDLRQINNLCYLRDGFVKRNNLYSPITDLDSVPFYDFVPINSYVQEGEGEVVSVDRNKIKKYSRWNGSQYSVMSSRGCPFSCNYCCNNFLSKLYSQKKVRRRSVDNIIEELERIAGESEINLISFQDDCFLSNSEEYIHDFCVKYKNKVNKAFTAHAIPIYVTEEKIRMLKEAGLSWVNLGLQSGSDHVNSDIYNRKSLKKDFLKAVTIVKKYNVASFCDVIVDSPFETEEDTLETIQTLTESPKPFYPQIFSLDLYLGTELYERAKRECPDKIEDFCKKDFGIYHKTVLNRMVRLSVFLPVRLMKVLMDQYKRKSLMFPAWLEILTLFSFTVFEPYSYFETMRLSCNGSYWKTIRILPNYFKRGIKGYLSQFWKADKNR